MMYTTKLQYILQHVNGTYLGGNLIFLLEPGKDSSLNCGSLHFLLAVPRYHNPQKGHFGESTSPNHQHLVLRKSLLVNYDKY